MTPTSERSATRSQELYCAAKRLIAGGTQTISKQPERFVEGVYPAYIDHARGARVWDLDGHEYLDYVLALGPVVLGYCDPDVDRAAKRAIDQGILHSANNPAEVELAGELCRLVPCAEMVRFFKGGADACSAAVRIARFVTGRNRIVCCGYHGWHDWWAGKRGEPGVPKQVAELTHDLPYGDTAALRGLLDEHGATLAMTRNLAELRADYGDFAAPSEERAAEIQRVDLRDRFAQALKEQLKFAEKNLPRELGLQFMPFGSEQELREQIAAIALERTCLAEPVAEDESAFEQRVKEAKGRVGLVAQEVARLLGTILAEHAALQKKLAGAQKAFPQACADIAAQLAELMSKRFVVQTPWERLQHFPRYLKAMALRLDKARNDVARDGRLLAEWRALAQPWERERANLRKAGVEDVFLQEFRWLLEELRVALFAQELRTPSPVSVKRLQKMWEGRARG